MERVLIVDDDPDIQRLVSYNLTQAGFEVATAETGRNALESVQEHPPDLIILDLMLPDVDGMEVCRILRKREPSRHSSSPEPTRRRSVDVFGPSRSLELERRSPFAHPISVTTKSTTSLPWF